MIKLRIASDIRLTENEVRAWLRNFCTGDLFNPEFRRNIIDAFINCIYLYDDRVIIFYNIKGGKQVSYIDLENTLNEDSPGADFSDMIANAPPQSVRKDNFRTDILYYSYRIYPSETQNRGKEREFSLRFPRFF